MLFWGSGEVWEGLAPKEPYELAMIYPIKIETPCGTPRDAAHSGFGPQKNGGGEL